MDPIFEINFPSPQMVEHGAQGEPATAPVVAHETLGLAAILNDIETYLEQFVNFHNESQKPICALWAVHTWVFERFRYTPYLHIFSPEKSCGKSNLLDSLGLIVARPWKVENLSEAALFHQADKEKPTMLWDEVDNVFKNEKDHAAIIGLLNGGFKFGGKAARCPRGVFTEYDVYCPKALTGIGRIPDTLHSRSIDIKLARAKPIAPFRENKAEPYATPIRAALKEWADKLPPDATQFEPHFPSEYSNDGRKCDITEPLLVLATLAGPEWLDKAEGALTFLCMNVEDMSQSIQLLSDCRDIFTERDAQRLPTITLINDLIEVQDANSPWPVWWEGDMKFGKTNGPAKKLAALLAAYDIKPRAFREGNEVIKGYIRSDFQDAWGRYLPALAVDQNRELDLEL